MRENFGYRVWAYFRIGWGTYFGLLFAGINTATVTYYLAIEKIPELNAIFPTFAHYLIIGVSIIIPILVFVGFLHYRRTAAFGTEAEIQLENNPYMYKVPLGWHKEALFPTLLKMTEYMIKSSNDEKLDDKSLQELIEINKKLDTLVKGGQVGKDNSKSSHDETTKK